MRDSVPSARYSSVCNVESVDSMIIIIIYSVRARIRVDSGGENISGELLP